MSISMRGVGYLVSFCWGFDFGGLKLINFTFPPIERFESVNQLTIEGKLRLFPLLAGGRFRALMVIPARAEPDPS